MKVAHLILTHKNPAQLERLIRNLEHPGFEFYVHLDKKTDAAPFLYLEKRKDTFFIKNRTPVYWAAFGTIQATLNGFEEILPIGGYDYINVISGQDFPLKPAHYIYRYIQERQGEEFITCESIEGSWAVAADRVRKYHLINWRIPGRFRLEKLVNAILPTPRKFPMPDHKIVGRANWFTLTPDAIRYSLDFLKRHPELIRFYKLCWGADEFIFSTILYNSHFRERIVDNLVYVDWTGMTAGHPRILQAHDLPALLQTDKLFGRKFDMDTDPAIFTLLEKHNTP
ncbi:MAG: glycosyl transferase [Bacteroidetes bacterium]|nr:glycosyl transferase [Bacteroidota bacterium]